MLKTTDSYWSQWRLDALIDRVFKAHDLDLSCFHTAFLAKALDTRAAALAENAPVYERRLTEDFSEAELFLRSLHIGYTEFFRNALAFAMLEHLILPTLINAEEKSGRGEIRIWSAGCATGQEAWSLAMLLDGLLTDRNTSFSYRIIATDRSAPDLAVARAGLYFEETVGNVRMSHLRRYFHRQGHFYLIVPRLRDRMDFTVHDLLDPKTLCPPESIFGDFDLVFCSNVLLYYRPEMQELILGKVRRCLTTGGYLICDETEAGIVETVGGFHRATPAAAIYIKNRDS